MCYSPALSLTLEKKFTLTLGSHVVMVVGWGPPQLQATQLVDQGR
jgi:hypothetical protein